MTAPRSTPGSIQPVGLEQSYPGSTVRAAFDRRVVSRSQHAGLGLAYVEKGELDHGISELERGRKLSHDRPDVLATLGYADAIAAKTTDATTILTQLRAIPRENNVSPCYLAEVLVGLGEKEEALAALEATVAQKGAGVSSLKANPIFDALRSEPRFQNLLIAIGLKP